MSVRGSLRPGPNMLRVMSRQSRNTLLGRPSTFWNTTVTAPTAAGRVPERVPKCLQCPVTYVPKGAESTAERARTRKNDSRGTVLGNRRTVTAGVLADEGLVAAHMRSAAGGPVARRLCELPRSASAPAAECADVCGATPRCTRAAGCGH